MLSSSVAAAIELLSRSRPLEFVRGFEHGAGGTSLVRLDGELVVVKAWASTPEREQAVSLGLTNATIMAERSVPIPTLVERGTVGGYGYVVYEFVDGVWPAGIDADLATQMLAITDLQRDAAPRPNPHWPGTVASMITAGDPSLDLHPRRLRDHPVGRDILESTQAAFDACDPSRLRCADVVHGDFAPENLLVRAGRISAVIDWEQSRVGDVAFDLAGMIYDIEIGTKATPQVVAALTRDIASRVPLDAWRLYTGIYAIRYASWALGTEMEAEVLDTIAAVTTGR
jgi:aminoglycoside phosphotransferase (APT) family kinase protein